MSKRKDRYEFIWQSIQIYGYKDDYREVNYKDSNTKVKILCSIHGEFWIRPHDYLNHHRCQKCANLIKANARKKDLSYYIEKINKIHQNENGTPKYDLNNLIYQGYDVKFDLKCSKHGYFKTSIHNLLHGRGCPKCGKESMVKKNTSTTEEFKIKADKIHNNFYIYDLVDYIHSKSSIKIICPIHGIFEQTPNTHLDGHGCPICRASLLEKYVTQLLTENKINYFFQCDKNTLSFLNGKNNISMSLDFYLPDYNVAIECQGIQHFKPIEYFGGEQAYKNQIERDLIKLKLCVENNIKLIYINYFDKKEIITEKINKIIKL